MSEDRETVVEIALLSTGTKTVEDALEVLEQGNNWNDFLNLVNDPRTFDIDEHWTKEMILQELNENK